MAQQRLFAYKPRCSLRYPGGRKDAPSHAPRFLVLYVTRTSSYRLSQMHVTSLNGLLFIQKLDWERVKKLGGKLLQLRLEDI
jgi:hypothetical protein